MTIGLIRLGFSLNPPDVTAPTVPTGLNGVPGDGSVSLSWTASTDGVGVALYKIYKGGTFLKNVTGTSTTDTGLTNGTSYSYAVSAVDAAGNESAQASFAALVPRTVWVSDAFTRAAGSSLGSTPVGAKAWTPLPAGDASKWALSGTTLQKVVGVNTVDPKACLLDSGHADGTIKGVMASGTATAQGLIFRASSDGGTNFLFSRAATTLIWSLKKRTAMGSYSTVWTQTTGTGAQNDVAKVVLNGSSISLYVNDVLLWSGTDAQGVTNTYEGFWAPDTAVTTFDLFEHNSLTA